jgi:hypothetical protein
VPQQLADAAEEADDMAITKGIPLLVADCLEKLVDPNGSIDGETLLVEGGEVRRPCAGLCDSPKALDTHDALDSVKLPMMTSLFGGTVHAH